MNAPENEALHEYYRDAASWAEDRERERHSKTRLAWIVASIAATVALVEAIALAAMMPLKKVEPVAVLVDRQTGFVQTLNLSRGQSITPDKAMIDAMLAQYVLAREGFNIAAMKEDYRKVALWSAGDARSQYIAAMQASNPASPLASLPRSTVLAVEIKSISPLSADSSLVRFITLRSDAGGQAVQQGSWASVIRYRFSSADMSAESRLVNPLGFQVLRYSRSAELPVTQQASFAPAEPQVPVQPAAIPAPGNAQGTQVLQPATVGLKP